METPLDGNDTFAILYGNIPTRLSELTNDEGFIADKPKAFGYSNLYGAPYNVSSFCNDAGYITNALGGFTATNLAGCNIVSTTDTNFFNRVVVSQYLGNYHPADFPTTPQPTIGTPITTNSNITTAHNVFANIAVSASNIIGTTLAENVMPAYLQPIKVFQGLTCNFETDNVYEYIDTGGTFYTTRTQTCNISCNFSYTLPNILIPSSNVIGPISTSFLSGPITIPWEDVLIVNTIYEGFLDINQTNYFSSNVTFTDAFTYQSASLGETLTMRSNAFFPDYVLRGQPNMAQQVINTEYKLLPNAGIYASNLDGQLNLNALPSFLKPTISYDVQIEQDNWTRTPYGAVALNKATTELTNATGINTTGEPLIDWVRHVLAGESDGQICTELGVTSLGSIDSILAFHEITTYTLSSNMRFSLGGFKNFQADYITTYGVATSSDARIKKNVVPLNSNASLSVIALLEPVGYRFIQDNTSHHGFIAQSVSKVLPEAVSLGSGKVPGNKEEVADFNYIDYAIITTHSVGAIQALKAEVDALKNRVASLEGLLG